MDAYEGALALFNFGFAVEAYEKSKGVKGPRAKRNRFDSLFDIEHYTFTDSTCVGISLSPGEVVVDLDADEAIALAPLFLPETGLISGRPGREMTHWMYKLEGEDPISKGTKFLDPSPLSNQKATLVEYIHASGTKTPAMVIMPPSPYDDPPYKQRASYDRFEAPHIRLADGIYRACGIVAAAALLARCWTDGQRNELTIAISGALLRENWKPQSIAYFIKAIAQYAGDEEWENRLVQPATTANRGSSGQSTYGWPTVGNIIGVPRATKLQEWLGQKATSKQSSGGSGGNQPPNASIPPLDIANAVYDEYQNRFRYVTDMQEWASYKGGLWIVNHDAKLDVEKAAIEVRQKLASQTRGAQPMSWKSITDSVSILKTMGLRATVDDFDNSPFLLNMPNGTYDLERGSVADHDPLSFISRQIPTPYDKAACCPFWEQQMASMWPDEEIRLYVQRVFGYALQGTQAERSFFLFFGPGRNGKSLCLRAVEQVLGVGSRGYAQQVATVTFARSSMSEINSGLAKLRGVRLATVGEFPNRSMNAELIKAITGGESNTSRQLYTKTAEFQFQSKLFFTSNFTPGPTDATDHAFWDRMKLIPCMVQFPNPGLPGNVAEATLLARFKSEASGILNWLLEGYRMWRENESLCVPSSLVTKLEEYKADLDLLEQFLEEDKVTVHPFAKMGIGDDLGFTTLTEVWETFDAWATRNGEDRRTRNQCRSRMQLRHALEQKGFKVGGIYETAGSKHRTQLKVYGIDIDMGILA